MARFVTLSVFRPTVRASRPVTQMAARNARATSTPYAGRKNDPVSISFGSIRFPCPPHIENQQPGSDRDCTVCAVERGTPRLTHRKLEEVRPLAMHDPIVNVAHGPAENQRHSGHRPP